MQVRHANDAELRRGFRFQRVVCSETGTWRGRGGEATGMGDGRWMSASFAFAFLWVLLALL